MSAVHYTLDEAQNITRRESAGSCIAYLIERDGIDVLCVMEGGAFHQYELSPQGVARIAEEAAKAIGKHVAAHP